MLIGLSWKCFRSRKLYFRRKTSKFIIGSMNSFFVVVQSLSCDQLFVTPWTAASQASLSFTISQSFLKFMATELVIPSNISSSAIPFSSCIQSFPASGYFLMSWLFASDGQVLELQLEHNSFHEYSGLISLGWTGWSSLQTKRLSRVFSNTTFQKHQIFGTKPSLWSSYHTHT